MLNNNFVVNKLRYFFQSNPNGKIYYITDKANWVLDEIADSLRHYIGKDAFNISYPNDIASLSNSIIHFTTIYNLNEMLKTYNSNNRYVITVFHIAKEHLELVRLLSDNQEKISSIHTSCNITRNELIKNGINFDKIIIIPIGIDINDFIKSKKLNKNEVRNKLGIPGHTVVIGSFQKDGNGWGEGDEPKLIKGPDIFCKVCGELKKRYDIFVLLLGPARGYVKKNLDSMGIRYLHIFEQNYEKMYYYYCALDLYLITSRIEGGPRALMESMASGVPLISTRVGQAPEIIEHGQNGYLTDIEDVEMIVQYSKKIIENPDLYNRLVFNGYETIGNYDYKILAQRYYNEIYKPLLKELSC